MASPAPIDQQPSTSTPPFSSKPQLRAYKDQLSYHLPFGVRILVHDPLVAFKYSAGAKVLSNFTEVDEPWVIKVGDLSSKCLENVYQAFWPQLAG